MWPQIVYVVLTLIGIGVAMEQHGKPRKGNYNFFITLAAAALAWFLLWKGGFFAPLLQ